MSPSRGTALRSIRIPDELWDAAHTTAAARGETVSEVIRRCLLAYINDPA